ncbi:MAG: WG repeat-containing protein [Leptospiraceae bacterium]|nr:WG repeat-containing protein [Leptospiraceae bacterium]MBK9502173.1 WG repeat-containing protein [Leptospiraceae bacterium]MBP9162981.1 WG repeat-containing protein [Leptospiraceae bacterium]
MITVTRMNLFSLFLLLPIFNPILAFPVSFEQNGLFGFKDKKGKVIIKPQYEMANSFSESGIAAVVVDGKWHFINLKGEKLARAFNFDNGPDYFNSGLARILDSKGKFGYMDEKGKIVIKPRFDFASPFERSIARVCMGCKIDKSKDEHGEIIGGTWYLINKRGNILRSLKK